MLRIVLAALMTFTLAPVAACAQGWDPRAEASGDDDTSQLIARSNEGIEKFLENDPTLQAFFDQAYGYVIFPRIAKGAFGVGAARGRGVVYRAGQPVYKAYVNQYSLGLAAGCKTYAQLIFFRDQREYDTFVDGEFEFGADASAIISTDGAGATTDYSEGVAVFTRERAGAMFEASLSGQRFRVRDFPSQR